MIQYVRSGTTDRDVQTMDNAVANVFNSLYGNPLLNNPMISTGLVFSSGVDLIVNHKLNRPVTGFIIINSNAAVNIYQSSTVNIAPTVQIILKSNANAIVSILFF